MEHQDSLPVSQEPSPGPYRTPRESSPHHSIYIVVFPSLHLYVFQVVEFLPGTWLIFWKKFIFHSLHASFI